MDAYMTSEMSEVSIAIATGNRLEMVRQALKDVLGQPFQDLEVIVVDYRPDPPLQLERDHRKASVVRLPKAPSLSAVRNAGLAYARGNWVTFLDDDDEIGS